METNLRRRVGRPTTGVAVSAAERMRRYRARLRERGIRVRAVMRRDPVLGAMRFGPATHLTPGEQAVLRRFCVGLGKLPVEPDAVAAFGSRVKGLSDDASDLDVVVFFDVGRDPGIESQLSRIALEARRPYCSGQYGIFLNPVPIFAADGDALLESIRDEMEVVWKRPGRRKR
jgi:hypothetical protein